MRTHSELGTYGKVGVRDALAILRRDTRDSQSLDGVVENDFDVPHTETALYIFAELLGVDGIEQELVAVNERDLLLLQPSCKQIQSYVRSACVTRADATYRVGVADLACKLYTRV